MGKEPKKSLQYLSYSWFIWPSPYIWGPSSETKKTQNQTLSSQGGVLIVLLHLFNQCLFSMLERQVVDRRLGDFIFFSKIKFSCTSLYCREIQIQTWLCVIFYFRLTIILDTMSQCDWSVQFFSLVHWEMSMWK